MDEARIISGLRACSAAAHEALYDTYAGELYDYCHALLQDDAAAAVALRETLLHAAASTESMPDGCSLRAWLYALARGRCRAAGERMIEHAMPEDDPSARLLISVLGTLTARDREVLELTGRHGLSETDLEPVLGLPADRVESLVADARRRFDQAMGEELDRTGPVAYPSLAGITEGDDPLALLYRALPSATPPSGQRPRILDDLLIAGTTGAVPAAFADHPSTPATSSGSSASTTEIPVPAHGSPNPRRKRALVLGGSTAAVLVLAAGVIVGLTQFSGSTEDRPQSAAGPTAPAQPSAEPTTPSSHTPGGHDRNADHGTAPPAGPGSTPSSGKSRTAPHGGRTAGPTSGHPNMPSHSADRPSGASSAPPRPPSYSRPPAHHPTHTPDPTPTTQSPTPTQTPTTNSATPTS